MSYQRLSDNLKARFGEKVYKLSLDGGMTCPTRDGTLDTRGCIFCRDGSGAFAERGAAIEEQIERAKRRVAGKATGGRYIAYFQSYTGTYAPVSYLRDLFSRAIAHPDVVALSVATRPDCLEREKIELLKELAAQKPVTVELGLQTVHEQTARYLRRGYATPVYDDAMARLRKAGLETVTHIILYLPGETEEMMLETVRHAVRCKTDGVKLQLLHVLEGTDLAKDYARGAFTLPTMERYVDTLEKCLAILPDRVVVHRLTGDGDKRHLIAPLWTADKKRVLNYINQRLQNSRDQTEGL